MVGRLPIGLLMYICKAHPIVLKLFPILVTHWLPWPWGCSCAPALPFQYRLAYTVSIKTICFYLDKQASLAEEMRLLFATSTRSTWSQDKPPQRPGDCRQLWQQQPLSLEIEQGENWFDGLVQQEHQHFHTRWVLWQLGVGCTEASPTVSGTDKNQRQTKRRILLWPWNQ